MWARTLTGAAALGLYGWRVHDPKASYGAFYDASDWLTQLVISGEGAWAWGRNMVNLLLIDQADGFLLGMAFMALLSIIFWPFRTCGRWCTHHIRKAIVGDKAKREDDSVVHDH